MIFCFAYGDHYDGTNHDAALSFARFAVIYSTIQPYVTFEESP